MVWLTASTGLAVAAVGRHDRKPRSLQSLMYGKVTGLVGDGDTHGYFSHVMLRPPETSVSALSWMPQGLALAFLGITQCFRCDLQTLEAVEVVGVQSRAHFVLEPAPRLPLLADDGGFPRCSSLYRRGLFLRVNGVDRPR